MTTNPRVVFAKWPESEPIPGEHLVFDDSNTIDVENVPLNGGFLTKLLLISPEPFLRERMRDLTKTRSYSTPMILQAPAVGMCVVKVLRSEKEGVEVGDYMYGMTHWELYTVQPYMEGRSLRNALWSPEAFDLDSLVLQKVPDPQGLYPLSCYCSLMGTPGLTGYSSLMTFASHKFDTEEQQTIFVSAGSGGVGTMVIQLAKLKGMKVIASAGTDEKVAYCKEIGADYAFNYKTETYKDALKKEGPIDIYYDNVGGVALEEAINATKLNALIIICGQISEYNLPPGQEPFGIKNIGIFFQRRLTMKGFLVSDLLTPGMMEKFLGEVPGWIATGQLKSREHLVHGIENAPQAFRDVLRTGLDQLGKPVVVVSED